MKVRQRCDDTMPDALSGTLAAARAARRFDAAHWLDAKTERINTYFERFGLDTAVVAMSGGVDSAVTLAVLADAATRTRSPIRRLVAATLPVHAAVTGQDEATGRATAEMDRIRQRLAGTGVVIDTLVIDCTAGFTELESATRAACAGPPDAWAQGQLAATVRTPVLYYLTSLAAAQGAAAVVAGTTNRDEGAWLGYVGKASDGMVDVQVISDLHKSEVYAVAELLEVTDEIRAVTPTGDMYDATVDTDVFGAPYDFVELYLTWLTWDDATRDGHRSRWSPSDRTVFDRWAASLERLHAHNAHKYLSGSPAVHLDVLPAAVPGGWEEHRWVP